MPEASTSRRQGLSKVMHLRCVRPVRKSLNFAVRSVCIVLSLVYSAGRRRRVPWPSFQRTGARRESRLACDRSRGPYLYVIGTTAGRAQGALGTMSHHLSHLSIGVVHGCRSQTHRQCRRCMSCSKRLKGVGLHFHIGAGGMAEHARPGTSVGSTGTGSGRIEVRLPDLAA